MGRKKGQQYEHFSEEAQQFSKELEKVLTPIFLRWYRKGHRKYEMILVGHSTIAYMAVRLLFIEVKRRRKPKTK